MHLPSDDFALLIDSAPLVSIDLIVRDAQGAVLLGYRRNRPTRDIWCVPGGRIRTHYVALGCEVELLPGAAVQADAQHAQLRWWPQRELMDSPLVHANTKRYFEAAPYNRL